MKQCPKFSEPPLTSRLVQENIPSCCFFPYLELHCYHHWSHMQLCIISSETQSHIWHGCCCLVAQSCLTLCNPMTVACQAPPSMGFSRQEYWSGTIAFSECNSRYGKKQQEEIFSWTKRLVRQLVQRILDTALWPSPVTTHWVAYQHNLCQTWEQIFSAPWDKMVIKMPPSKPWSSL